jgi:outer membrane lipoprotein-sorting protein
VFPLDMIVCFLHISSHQKNMKSRVKVNLRKKLIVFFKKQVKLYHEMSNSNDIYGDSNNVKKNQYAFDTARRAQMKHNSGYGSSTAGTSMDTTLRSNYDSVQKTSTKVVIVKGLDPKSLTESQMSMNRSHSTWKPHGFKTYEKKMN